MSKKVTAQISAVIKGIFFIGFSIQIILGIIWMCCNFMRVQDFGAPETTLYGGVFRLLGECAPVMYLLQLAAAFGAGYFLMQSVSPAKRWLAIWRGLALLTFPFAMQCHLAIQPHSLVGTLFLMILAFVVRGMKRRREWCWSLLFAVLLICMTGVADRDSREELAAKGLEGIMASRMAWSTLMNDTSYWPEELQTMTEEVHFDTTICPGNMELLLNTIRDVVGEKKAREYYKIIAQTGWEIRKPVIIRQIGWDVLGYTFTPIIAQLQLAGEPYDSYTGGNYEKMRAASPVWTRYYVDYGSWWFCLSLILCVVGSIVLLLERRFEKVDGESETVTKSLRFGLIPAIVIWIVVVGLWVTVLTFRGAGMMDYKWTIAVNQLWIVWAMMLVKTTREI